jgi:hypothetical protein
VNSPEATPRVGGMAITQHDPAWRAGGSELRPGQYLYLTSLTSESGRFALQNTLYEGTALFDNATGAILWKAPDDNVYGSSKLVFGLDGDLAVWNHHRDRGWRSGTAGRGADVLRVTDSGDLVLLDADARVLWTSETALTADPFPLPHSAPARGSVLRRGQSLRHQSLSSADGGTVLLHTERGVSLCLAQQGEHWFVGAGQPGSTLMLDDAGMLRLTANGQSLHEIAGPGEELVVLVGRAELRDAGGHTVWATPDVGQFGESASLCETRPGPRQADLEPCLDSLAPDHGYTVAVILDVTPDESLARWGLTDDAVSRTTWQQLQARRADDEIPVAAVPLGTHTLLIAGAPWLPGDPLSPGTTVVRESRLPELGWATEWTMHRGGKTTAHRREIRPKRRKGMSLPELSRAAADVTDVDSHRRGNAEYLALFAGLELMCRVAGVSPTADDLSGALVGGFLPASSAQPPEQPVRTPPARRPPIPQQDFVLVRTDFSDDGAWATLLQELTTAEFAEDYPVTPVNDRGWSGAGLDEVVAAVTNADEIPAVYVADTEAMTTEGYPLLAFNTDLPEPSADYESDGVSRTLRVTADALITMHLNLELANMDWEDFLPEPDQAFRGFS